MLVGRCLAVLTMESSCLDAIEACGGASASAGFVVAVAGDGAVAAKKGKRKKGQDLIDAVRKQDVRTASTEHRPVEFHTVSDKGLVFVDKVSEEQWVATHIVTRERIPLTGTAYEVVYGDHKDDESFGVLAGVRNETEVVIEVRDLFKRKLAQCGESQAIVLPPDATHPNGRFFRPHEEYLRQRTMTAHLRLPVANVFIEMTCWVFAHPRCLAQRVFWSYACVHKVCCFQGYKGAPSKWWDRFWPKWTAAFIQSFGSTQCVQSVWSSHRTAKKNTSSELDRCLPDPGVSTIGLMHHLVLWSALKPENGGVRSDATKRGCETLLQALLHGCSDDSGACELPVTMDRSWMPRWPRPEWSSPDGLHTVHLTLQAGVVDFSSLRCAATRADRIAAAHVWNELLCNDFGENTEAHLDAFLYALSRQRAFRSLLCQVLLSLSLALEKRLARTLQLKGRQLHDEPAWMEWSGKEMPRGGFEMEHRLACYVASCQAISRNQHVWGASTDDGMIHGLPLHTTLLSTPNNVMMLACPQVGCFEHHNQPPATASKSKFPPTGPISLHDCT